MLRNSQAGFETGVVLSHKLSVSLLFLRTWLASCAADSLAEGSPTASGGQSSES